MTIESAFVMNLMFKKKKLLLNSALIMNSMLIDAAFLVENYLCRTETEVIGDENFNK
jgi:hypothetical protein